MLPVSNGKEKEPAASLYLLSCFKQKDLYYLSIQFLYF